MNKLLTNSALAALIWCSTASAGLTASPEEERLLGCGCEDARLGEYLPFTRRYSASGVVRGSLSEAAAERGVPAAAMVEALDALGAGIDLKSELRSGDRYYVRYERSFTAAGDPIEIGQVLWVELDTRVRGKVSVHRFKPRPTIGDRFWLLTGDSTATPRIGLPLENVLISSGFGMRAHPFEQPLSSGAPRKSYSSTSMVMHAGIDLVAELGTPIRAAGDGVVLGAEMKGGYGNWIEIEHECGAPGAEAPKFATVYGHLSGFAPGIVPGLRVKRGDEIGYVGSTGRSTAPHLHFEILENGRPIDPMNSPALQLHGDELLRFKKQVDGDLRDREREREAGST
jgi:murein DD-endopeptidase MepM/ murein hydrolase activator NlpD